MDIIKPLRLKRGDCIGVVAPGSPPASIEKLSRGVRYLEQLGYRVVLGKHAKDHYGYLAGKDRDRAKDLNDMFANRKVKAIFMVRGGYGSPRILPLLDYGTVRRNPKILMGYSDITALSLAIYAQTGLVTFSGPMVGTDFAGNLNRVSEEHLWRCLTSIKPLGFLQSPIGRKFLTVKQGKAAGRLIGGNLSVVTALLGTPYVPSLKHHILALEEIDEPPYKVDRMLNHLRLAGAFTRGGGVVFGQFTNCQSLDRKKPSLTLPLIFREILSAASVPAISGLPYGHVEHSLTLPIGVRAKLDASRGSLEIVEAAVE